MKLVFRLLSLVMIYFLIFIVGCTQNQPDTGESDKKPGDSSPSLRFTDVTETAGLSAFRHETGAFGRKWFPESMGSGGGFLDYNGDGWQDILLIGGGTWPQYTHQTVQILWLYRNNQDGTFTQVTREAGLADLDTYAFGVTVGDYDNDGDDDFFLTTLYTNMLFRNENGVFQEVAGTAGLADRSEYTSAALFFDADRDGWLDLYVGNYADWTPAKDIFCSVDGHTKSYCRPDLYESIPGRFYHNNHNGTFSDWTKQAGFLYPPEETPGNALSLVQFDYNRDGWPDLAISNDSRRNLLYQNNGDGTFTERGIISGIAFDENGRPRSSMGMDAGNVNNDGQLTVFIGTFAGETLGAFQSLGNGLFMDRAAVWKVARPALPYVNMGLFLFDVDLDQDLDLFICNGHIHQEIDRVQEGISYLEPSQLFLNRGDGTFEDVSPGIEGVMSERLAGRGAAFADYDQDGDPDILVTEAGGPAHLWRNDLQDHHAIRVRLEGQKSNRDGIGSKLLGVAGDTRMHRWVRTGGSYLSCSEYLATFGLGTMTRLDSLMVTWPSGIRDTLTGIPADQQIRITEGTGHYTQEHPFR